MDHLVKLCVLSNSNHKLLLVQVVHLRSTNRDDIDRSDVRIAMSNPGRNVSNSLGLGRFESGAAVGVVVALEHQIDVVFIQDRLPKCAHLDVVTILCGRENGMMESTHDPRRGVFRKRLIEPRCLFLKFKVAIQDNEASILVHKGIAGFLKSLWAMTRKCELGSPVMRDRAIVFRPFVHLVIPNHRNVRNRRVEPSTCSEPLTPFPV